jgi:hypothetical protein
LQHVGLQLDRKISEPARAIDEARAARWRGDPAAALEQFRLAASLAPEQDRRHLDGGAAAIAAMLGGDAAADTAGDAPG